MLVDVRKPTVRANFKPFNFLVQQHENTDSTDDNTIIIDCSISFEGISLWFRTNMHVIQRFD